MNIIENLRTKCDWCEPCSRCVTLMDGAAQEIERTQAIVDRLPKTADGVPIVPGYDSVWWSHPTINPAIHARRVLWSDRYGRWILQGVPEYGPADAYSTLEGAESARR